MKPGTHGNVLGPSYAGPVEVDNDFVVRSRFFVDSREGVLQQGAGFLRAKRAGLIGDDHIVGKVGHALAGEAKGRQSDEVTVYKSLGRVMQDMASAWALYQMRPNSQGKNSSTSLSDCVRRYGGRLLRKTLPYGFFRMRLSRSARTPRSLSERMRRPKPCFKVMTAAGTW